MPWALFRLSVIALVPKPPNTRRTIASAERDALNLKLTVCQLIGLVYLRRAPRLLVGLLMSALHPTARKGALFILERHATRLALREIVSMP